MTQTALAWFGLVVGMTIAAMLLPLWPDDFVELDRASVGTVLVRPAAVDAILGPGEVLLDDGAGTRHNAHTQVVIGALRINVRGTAAQVCDALDC